MENNSHNTAASLAPIGGARPSGGRMPADAQGARFDELAAHLEALRRQECYVVDEVLKESPTEITQRVHFQGANGAAQGPFIRKYIDREAGLGSAYARIFAAQQAGRRFRYIPRIYDCELLGEQTVVIMECVRGETLDEAIYRCDPSMALAADVFPRLCDAVSELHEEFDPPIVHRDLKPGNIMLSNESLTIIDFGISRTCRQGAEADTARFGTRAYAPPEQFGFAQTTVRSDVYALGLLLYYCLVEAVPDAAARERGFAHADIPEPIRRVIAKAASFDPEQRYGSARELKAAFEAALGETGFVLAGGEAGFVPAESAADNRRRPGILGKAPGYRRIAGRTRQASTARAADGARPGVAAASQKPAHASLAQRIPKGIGVAWNIVVALMFSLTMGVALYMPFDPNNTSIQGMPLWFAIVEYWFMIGVMVASSSYALLDRRRLQVRFPALARLNWWQTFLAMAVVWAIAIVVTVIVGWPYTQTGAA